MFPESIRPKNCEGSSIEKNDRFNIVKKIISQTGTHYKNTRKVRTP